MKRLLLSVVLAGALHHPVAAQDLAGEVTITAGASTDDVSAGAVQGRVFGDVAGTRVFAEASLASMSGEDSEAFGAAYPYERRVRVMEAYAERLFRKGRALAGVRAGRFRTPFGIYNGSDHAYGGFLRAPMIRYGGYWALSNTFLEHGVNLIGGVASLQGEYTLGVPADVGDALRRDGRDHLVRVQGYHGPLVVGGSHMRTSPYQPSTYAFGRTVFNGVDARWMAGGLQVRGEWLDGRPFDGVHTRGGYLDVLVHRREMGPVTALARFETVDYSAGVHSTLSKRATAGARIDLGRGVVGQVNAAHQSGALYSEYQTSVDFAVSYTLRFAR